MYVFRCIFTTVDPDSGLKSKDQQPLKTLRNYRMNEEIDTSGPLFGIYLNLDYLNNNNNNSLFVSVGDIVYSN